MQLPTTEALTLIWLALIGLVFLLGLVLLFPMGIRWWQIRRLLKRLPRSTQDVLGEDGDEARRKALTLLTDLPWLREPVGLFARTWSAARLPKRNAALDSPSLDDFLNAAVVLPWWASRRVARSLPATLVALGILGTFLGLVFSLPAIGGFEQGADAQPGDQARQLQELLATVINGLKLAFWTSIAGIGLSVVVGTLDRICEHALERSIARLSGATRQIFPVLSAGELARVHHLLIDDAAQSVKTVGTDVATALNNAFATHMQPAMSAIQTSVEDLVGFASQEQVAGLEKLVGRVFDSMNDAMGDQFGELKGVLEATVSSQERMGEGLREFNDQLERSARTQGALIDETRRAAETLSGSLDRLETISKLLEKAAADVMTAGQMLNESAVEAARSQKSALEAQRQLSEAAESHANAMQRARDDLMQAWDAAAKQAQGTIHQIQEATKELSKGIGDQLVTALEKFDGALAQTIDRFSGTLAQVDGSVGELPPAATAMRESAEAMSQHSKAVEEGLRDLEKLVTGLVAENVEKAATAAAELKDSVDVSRSTTSDLHDLARQLSASVRDVVNLQASLKETDTGVGKLSEHVSGLNDRMELAVAPLEALASALDGGGRAPLQRLTAELTAVSDRLQQLRSSIDDASKGGGRSSWWPGRS